MKQQTVILGMSGGVDSSVSAYLLKEAGYKVIGLFMKNWQEEDSSCSAEKDFTDVIDVCHQLDIPYYTINFTEEYQEKVFSHFLKGYEMGLTPNPDILCNQEIKFKLFFEKALELGGDFLATGHYAQTENGKLFKGKDPSKDQSYFIYTLKKEVLQKVLFPVGHLFKKEVKELAQKLNLCTAEKKESMGICFIGKRDFRPFLQRYLKKNPGPIQTLEGTVVGEHEGVAFYTLGQRKGLKIGGKGDAWFVCKKDPIHNILYVVQNEHHTALYTDSLIAGDISFVDNTLPNFPLSLKAKVRYRQNDQDCTIEKMEGAKLYVSFKEPQRAVTPGQSVVFYDDMLCLGGAIIEKAGPSFYEQNRPLPAIDCNP